MQLKSLELSGFKSFPDKTLITFSHGITAIVGPNGSGKSNIADALRWVMGETSSKSLRGVKMEDVIFDGTQSRKPLGLAEVSLTLDNSDGKLPTEYNEVEITRRFYRSGESEYLINRQPVRLKDIHDILMDTGLGSSGYSIIGQGVVTEIISAKSTDRRYVFEEAAGIAKFKYKKEESEKRLASAEENILRLSDILSELKERLPSLEQQAKKARKYIELFDEKKKLEISLWINDLSRLSVDIKKADEDVTAINKSIEANENEIIRCETETERLANEIADLTAKIESLRAEGRKIEDSIQEKNSKILLIKNDIEHAKSDIDRLNAEINDSEKNDSETENEIKSNVEEKEKIDYEIAEKISEENKLTEERKTKFEAENRDIVEELRQNRNKLNEELTHLEVEKGRLEQYISALHERDGSEVKEVEDALKLKEETDKKIEKSDTRKSELENKLEENKNIQSGYLLKSNSAKKKLERLNEEYTSLRLSVSDAKNKKTMLEDMEKHFEGFAGSVKSIMNEAARGSVKGVCGTVASVIKTDDKYTVATEIALGASIQNIITEDEKSAKDCIYLLKTRNLGRATFQPISTVKGSRLDEKRLENAIGYIGLACDLVRFDEKYRGIIEALLGKTAVVEDINDATDLGNRTNHTFKIVTLDGQVVNPGGSLTGGSVGKNVGILSRANETERLAKSIEEMMTRLNGLSDEIKAATAEMNAVTAYIDGMSAESKTAEQELIKITSETEYEKQLLSRTEERIVNLKKSSEERKTLYTQTERDLSSIGDLIENKRSEIEVADKKVDELSKERDVLTEKLHEKELERLELEKKSESIQIIINSLTERLQSGKQLAEKKREEIKETNELIKQYEAEIDAQNAELEALKGDSDTRVTEISKLNTNRNDSEAKKNKINNEEKNFLDIRGRLGRESEKLTTRQESLKNEESSISSKIWDEYEMTLTDAEQFADENKIEDFDVSRKRVSELKNQIKALGSVNIESIDEFAQVKERHDTLEKQINDLVTAKESLLKIISQLVSEMTEVFDEKFKLIASAFSDVFKDLFGGGTAKLTLTDSENLLESGIEIYVAPPGKVIKHLSSLSGGEQSLTAIALYFALLRVRPSPFCLLDEIESALDDINVVRYANYLRNLSESTQFLLITHRRGSMEAADRLYGVTMREKGISKILAINVDEIENGSVE